MAPGTLAGTTFTVSTLTLKTSCLCDPCVKLEFASTLAYSSPTTIDSTVVNFQVFKLCHNQLIPTPVGFFSSIYNSTSSSYSWIFWYFTIHFLCL
ncbi:DUF4489 domain-containing protein (plasmid) [Clostridium estertheticum]|uniref:DUF4489 domain-containing protein n=1 Tax=Clostridium estertheticum TaxID=238834 RepID=UPI0022DD6CB2|nr:DUF4489 domain-containing protein [Clostridium estertheticum]WBL49576.1 DUF4489 domain-containing protein [Clostridium estertheticum]